MQKFFSGRMPRIQCRVPGVSGFYLAVPFRRRGLWRPPILTLSPCAIVPWKNQGSGVRVVPLYVRHTHTRSNASLRTERSVHSSIWTFDFWPALLRMRHRFAKFPSWLLVFLWLVEGSSPQSWGARPHTTPPAFGKDSSTKPRKADVYISIERV